MYKKKTYVGFSTICGFIHYYSRHPLGVLEDKGRLQYMLIYGFFWFTSFKSC